MVRGFYDQQKLRIEMGNRLCAQFRAKLGLKQHEKEDEDEDAAIVLDTIRSSYKKMTDGIKRELPTLKGFKGDEVISNYTELCLVAQYMEMEERENRNAARIATVVKLHPLWDAFFDKVDGCGPTMASVILSEIDIHKARYPSSLWQYAGYGVEADGKGTSKRKEHLHPVKYVNKEGKEDVRQGIRYNPWLKTKLHVLCTCFIKQGGKYRKIYDDYKSRLENSANVYADKGTWSAEAKGHRHAAAMRYTIKIFLIDLYNAWRPLEGLPVAPTYAEAKLGIVHSKLDKAA